MKGYFTSMPGRHTHRNAITRRMWVSAGRSNEDVVYSAPLYAHAPAPRRT
jgi:hypothetical protein